MPCRRSWQVALVGLLLAGFGATGLALASGAAAKHVHAPRKHAHPHRKPVPRLGAPQHVRVAAIGRTYLTVAAGRSANATHYRLYASSTKSDLYYANLSHRRSHRAYAASTRPTVTVHRLTYATSAYYFRFVTTLGHHMRLSPIRAVRLLPAAPTAVTVSDAGAPSLSWTSRTATTGFRITQATNAAMTEGRIGYTIRRESTDFTPYGLVQGTRYWFRIRGFNGTAVSHYSASVSRVVTTSEQPVKVVTYNVLKNYFDGTAPAGETVAPWSDARRDAAAALLTAEAPDVIAVQEGAGWVDGQRGDRQVDSLVQALGPGYSLARTEMPPDALLYDYLRTGDYIIYRNSVLEPVGAGGNWSLGDGEYGVYQALRNTSSGAEFLAVSTHLRAGSGASYDALRRQQAEGLLPTARSIAAAHGGLPIVVAGDFNSRTSFTHSDDAPRLVMSSAHLSDTYYVTQSLTNAAYSTNNRYERTPPQGLDPIDRIFVDRGVAVHGWNELLRVSNGRFVGVIPSDHNPVVSEVGIPY